MGSRVSSVAGENFQLVTASWAALINTGFPPTAWTDFTDPLGATITSKRTVPVMLALRASSGYVGTTRCTILRSADVLSEGLSAAHTSARLTARTSSRAEML